MCVVAIRPDGVMTAKSDSDDTPVTFVEALEQTGNGLYNVLLVMTGSLILLAIGMDMFGLSLVVAAACDLNLTTSQRGVLTSLPFIGILLVSYFWGYVSDTRGRRFTLVVPLMASFLLTCVGSFSPHWLFLGLAKFFTTCFACAANSVTYTLIGESCIQRVRNRYMVLMTCLILLSPAVAGIVTYPTLKLNFAVDIPWLGIVYRPWRLLLIVQSLPSALGAICVYFFCESPKFLYNSGKQDEALKVLKTIYDVNHRGSKVEYPVKALNLDAQTQKKTMSLIRAMYEQSAPLFREPYVWKTIQILYIVGVVYITNNSFLVWLPYILNIIRLSLTGEGGPTGNICKLLDKNPIVEGETHSTDVRDTAELCSATVDHKVILTLIASQSIFAFLNFLLSYLQNRRRVVLITILCTSSFSGIALNVVPESISSVIFFIAFTCTCLGMGILASYIVDIYPTSYSGMAACLSIMVGRSSTFVGINVVGVLLETHCHLTFYLWSILVFSSAVAAWYLPRDKPPVPVPMKTVASPKSIEEGSKTDSV